MQNRFDRRGAVLRVLATGTVFTGLASCSGSSFYTYDSPNSVVVADFNGDGFLDVAVASAHIDQTSTTEQPGFVALILQNSSNPGNFQSSVHFATDGNPSAMAVGDIAGGGSTDLAVANFNKGTISVLLETAPNSGTFQNQVSVPAGTSSNAVNPSDVAICDVNGDGQPDLVVTSGNTAGGSVVWIPGLGGGKFGTPVTIGTPPVYTAAGATVASPAYGVACGNLNGDGHSMDVVVTSFYRNNSVGVYGASGMLSIFLHDPANPGGFQSPVNVPISGLAHRVKIADINGDGLPDIIVSDEGVGNDSVGTPGAVILLQNPQTGSSTPPTFAAPVTIATDSAVSLAVADLNGDGMPDLIVTTGYAASSNADVVEVLMNTTTKGSTTVSFSSPSYYAGFGNPASVAIGDLNHDGLPDIATADGTGAVVYFQQTGSAAGTFATGLEVGG